MTETLDSQVAYWNGPGSAKRFSHPVNLARLEELLSRTSSIVEIGCGYGRVLEILFRSGYRNLAGFDTAEGMVEAARARLPEVRIETIAGNRIPLPDSSVDALLLFAVLTCIPTDPGQRALLEEARRLLHPGGLLYISDLWLQPDARNRDRYDEFAAEFGTYGVFRLPEGGVFRHHDRAWIAELTEGFQRIALDEIRVETMNGHSARAFQWFGRRLAPS